MNKDDGTIREILLIMHDMLDLEHKIFLRNRYCVWPIQLVPFMACAASHFTFSLNAHALNHYALLAAFMHFCAATFQHF